MAQGRTSTGLSKTRKIDKDRNVYICPAGKILTTTGRLVNDGETLLCMASMHHCRSCPLKAQCCPKAPFRRMLFAHLKRILRLGRLRLRGPRGVQFEFTLAAIAQNLRRLAKLVARPPPLSSPRVA